MDRQVNARYLYNRPPKGVLICAVMEMFMAHDLNGTRHLFWRRAKELARNIDAKLRGREISFGPFIDGM